MTHLPSSVIVSRGVPPEADILVDTISGDPGAHGPYPHRERGADAQMVLRRHPTMAAAAFAAVAAAGARAVSVHWRRS